MKSLPWISGFALSLAAFAANSACTVTVTNSDGGDDGGSGLGEEASTISETGTQPETGTSPDSGTTPDTSTTPEASTTPETGTTADTGSTADGGDGGTCSVLQSVSFGSMACDRCLGDNCCNETTACFTGAENDCESEVSCFLDCLAGKPDAGVAPGNPTTCKSDCAGLDAMTTAFDTWLSCQTNNCATACQ